MPSGLDRAYPEFRREEIRDGDGNIWKICRYYPTERGGGLFVEEECNLQGLRHGPFRVYHRNGSLAFESYFQNGLMVDNRPTS